MTTRNPIPGEADTASWFIGGLDRQEMKRIARDLEQTGAVGG